MDFIALLIIILGVTLIIWVMGFLKPTDANEDEQIPSEIIENRDLRRDGDVSDAPFVPQIGLEDLVAVLPKKYWQYFEHSSDEAYVVPNDNSVVGNLRMTLVWQEAIVQIGEHTELRFKSANSAFAFVGKVLRDEFVFRIGESETVICPVGDFEDSGEADRNDYVWSGPLKYKLLFRSQ